MKVIIIVAIFTIVYVLGMDLANKYISQIPSNSIIDVEHQKQTLSVSIRGAISYPGSFEVESNSNLNTLIALAGGLTSNADMSAINTSVILQNGQDYYIPYVNYDSNNVSIKVSINTASGELLQTLPNIGEVYARRIIEYRNNRGDFKTIEEIQNVNGIGKATFEKLKDLICL